MPLEDFKVKLSSNLAMSRFSNSSALKLSNSVPNIISMLTLFLCQIFPTYTRYKLYYLWPLIREVLALSFKIKILPLMIVILFFVTAIDSTENQGPFNQLSLFALSLSLPIYYGDYSFGQNTII